MSGFAAPGLQLSKWVVMKFNFKDNLTSKCDSCVHAQIVQTHDRLDKVTICNMLGHAVRSIKECNRHQNIVTAPIPMHMAMTATIIDVDMKRVGKVGFGGGRTEPTVTITPPKQKGNVVEVEPPDDFDFGIDESSDDDA